MNRVFVRILPLALALLAFAASPAAATPVATDVSAGRTHTCAVIDAGAWCWGANDLGQLGDGTQTDRSIPTKVAFSAPEPVITQISAGWAMTCALDSTGKVWCWGRGNFGALGNGQTGDPYFSTTPVEVQFAAPAPTIVKVAAEGMWHACAIDSAGGIWCWGHGGSGRMGDGDEDDELVPVNPIDGGTPVTSGATDIAVGPNHTCAVISGVAKCWGFNGQYQLGVGDTTNRMNPTAIYTYYIGTGALAISAGVVHTCALSATSAVFCWGDNTIGYDYAPTGGQLGISYSASPWPYAAADIGSPSTATQVSAGDYHNSCALRSDGAGLCWGEGSAGQLGIGSNPARTMTPLQVGGGFTFSEISSGESHSCAISDGIVKCFGSGASGRLGTGNGGDQNLPTDIVIAPTVSITSPDDGDSTTDQAASIAFVSDGLPAPSCTVNDAAATSKASVELTAGPNTITVVCTNSAGSASASITLTRYAAPVVAITSPADGFESVAGSVEVSFTADGYPAPTCDLNGSPATSPASLGLVDGLNPIILNCSNSEGYDSHSITVFHEDALAPSVAITSPSDNSFTWNDETVLDLDITGFPTPACTLNGGSFNGPSVLANLDVGPNSLTVECVNPQGSASDSITVTRNQTPGVSINYPSNGYETTSESASIGYDASGYPVPTCTINGTPAVSGSSVHLSVGSNMITVACTNEVKGTTYSDSQTITIYRSAAPVLTIPRPDYVSEIDGKWVAERDDVIIGFTKVGYPSSECTKDGAAAEPNDVTILAPGRNTFTFVCTNSEGSDTKTVEIYRTFAPTVTIDSPVDGSTSTEEYIDVRWTVTGFPTPVCSVNGEVAADTVWVVRRETAGPQQIDVTCTNTVEEAQQSSTATVNVTRTAVPQVTISSPADGASTAEATASVTFTATGLPAPSCTIGGVAASSPATVALAPGANTISVTCTNSAGADTKTIVVTRTMPAAPPAAAAPSITRVPKSARAGKSIKLSVTGCSAGCTLALKLKIGKKTVRGVKSVKVPAGATSVRVKLSKKAVAQVKKALKRSKRTKVTLAITPSAPGAEQGKTRTLRIR